MCFCNSVNCSGHTEYKVNFDSNRLTEDCVKNKCQLKDQIDEIIEEIGNIGKYGNCRVDEVQTKNGMEQEINKRNFSFTAKRCFKVSTLI